MDLSLAVADSSCKKSVVGGSATMRVFVVDRPKINK